MADLSKELSKELSKDFAYCEDTISRKAAIEVIDAVFPVDPMKSEYAQGIACGAALAKTYVEQLPSAQPESKELSFTHKSLDTVSRQEAIKAADSIIERDTSGNNDVVKAMTAWKEYIKALPPAQPGCEDTVYRKAVQMLLAYFVPEERYAEAVDGLRRLPSAQPERTCVNCGRTVNNGGWYADGRTRCPIEEHYALPKDGYCHLWEKRNVTDDDYPERREE